MRKRGRRFYSTPFSRSLFLCLTTLCLFLPLGGCTETPSIFQSDGPQIKPWAQTPIRHVIWITADALRADHLELYGYYLPTAPWLRHWAATGYVFDRCLSQGIQTVISTRVLLFGRYNHHLFNSQDETVQQSNNSLCALLRQRGYTSALFTNHGFFPLTNQLGYFDSFLDEATLAESTLAARALDWQLAAAEKPTFLWMHLFAPHSSQPQEGERFEWALASRRQLFPEERYPADVVKESGRKRLDRLWATYDVAIGKADEAINLFLRGLQQNGGLNDSLIIISADHGEHLGPGPILEHGHWTWRSVAHVPLVVLAPTAIHEAFGPPRRVPVTVRHIDLLPTTLEAANILPSATTPLDGLSLWRVLDGTVKHSLPAFTDGVGDGLPLSRSLEIDHFVLWRIEGGKSIRYRLFDLRDGPLEKRDVRFRHPPLYRRLRKELDALSSPETGLDAWRSLHPSPKEMERLKAIGYLN